MKRNHDKLSSNRFTLTTSASKKTSSLNASSIVSRLPFHQQLTSAQATLIKCLPIWQQWSTQYSPNQQITNTVSLSHFDISNGTLVMHCENAISATQLQQHQHTILAYFQNQGLEQITHISVRMANKPKYFQHQLSSKRQAPTTDDFNIKRNQISDSAINSINHCRSRVTNSQLSESLTRLLNTIKKTTR